MTDPQDGIRIPIRADLSEFDGALKDLQTQSQKFGSVFAGTIKGAIASGRSFDDTLKTLVLRLSNLALSAGLKPLETAASGLLNNLVSGIGQSFGGGSIVPFEKGGVVSSPTFFGAGGQLGVMGEAGAEAILPLSRGSDGRLGVRSQSSSNPINVTFNVSTPDAQSFRRSEAQLSSMLARAVGRGRRAL